ncbi:MAG: tetratricopeptide repeat protein, partial [Planctomycetota bacterium]
MAKRKKKRKPQRRSTPPKRLDMRAALRHAMTHLQADRLGAVETVCNRMLAVDTRCAPAHMLLGIVADRGGDAERAIRSMETAVGLDPSNADYASNLGAVLQASGRVADAEALFRKALELQPAHVDARFNRAKALKALERLDEADAAWRALLDTDPSVGEAWAEVARGLRRNGRRVEAEEMLVGVDVETLARADDCIRFGDVCREFGLLDAGRAAYGRALRLAPDSPRALNNLGMLLREAGETTAAREALERALAIDPNHSQALNNLGSLHNSLGDPDAASDLYRRALRQQPGRPDVLVNLAQTRRLEAGDPLLDELQAAYGREDLSDAERTVLCFALGRAWDALGEYDRAFTFYRDGNALKRSSFTYDVGRAVEKMRATARVFDDAFFARHAADRGTRLPIAICTMPRSGSSLIEQILTSHPEVGGVGELMEIPRLFRSIPLRLGRREDPLALVPELGEEVLGGLAKDYEARL